jgi:Fic family protein
MTLNKTSASILLFILRGHNNSAQIAKNLGQVTTRTIQRSLERLEELGLATKDGPSNNPTYGVNYALLLKHAVAQKIFFDSARPYSIFNFGLLEYLKSTTEQDLSNILEPFEYSNQDKHELSLRDIEYLTIEISWKSSELEGNTYTMLDTELLLKQGIKAKDKTEFETQMILNHKAAVEFIVGKPELFSGNIEYRSVEHLHGLIVENLGIEKGTRKRVVKIGASNYSPMTDPHKIEETMQDILSIINSHRNPFTRSLLALSLVPYLQGFEDGNKRTGRMLSNAILISSIGKSFSLKNVDAQELALAYLPFYEFNSLSGLNKIFKESLETN